MSTERINARFAERANQKRTLLVAYLTIGDPSIEDSLSCCRAALDAGADLLELGVPFSDPTADGPVIAAASHRAIQAGSSLRAVLKVAAELRRSHPSAPLVLFTYYNPVVAFGEIRFVTSAIEAGADGALIVDLPPEEGSELRAAARNASFSLIPLVAPTTGAAREPKVLAGASGFIYYVSVTGITGAGHAVIAEAAQNAARLSKRAGLPVVLGFGIRTPQHAREAAEQGVNGIVVGTEIVRAIAGGADSAARVRAVHTQVAELRAALDAVAR